MHDLCFQLSIHLVVHNSELSCNLHCAQCKKLARLYDDNKDHERERVERGSRSEKKMDEEKEKESEGEGGKGRVERGRGSMKEKEMQDKMGKETGTG